MNCELFIVIYNVIHMEIPITIWRLFGASKNIRGIHKTTSHKPLLVIVYIAGS